MNKPTSFSCTIWDFFETLIGKSIFNHLPYNILNYFSLSQWSPIVSGCSTYSMMQHLLIISTSRVMVVFSSIETSSCRFHFSLKSLNHTVLMPGLSSWQGHVMLCYVWTFMWCTAHLSEDVTLNLTFTSAVLSTLLLFIFHSDCFYSCSCCHTNPS
jgi:hypothetical protein